MKTTLITSLLCLVSNILMCQYMTVGTLTIIPQTPNTSDAIKIITKVNTSNYGIILNNSILTNTVSGNIYARACYFIGMLTTPRTIIDTINVGILQAGSYTVNFKALSSSTSLSCAIIDSTAVNADFNVIASLGTQELSDSKLTVLYPNPTNNLFSVLNNQDFKLGDIIDLNGQIVKHFILSENNFITIDDLIPSVYFVNLYGREINRTLKLVKLN